MCLLFVISCLAFVGCCVLVVMCCLLSGVVCLLYDVAYRLLSGVRVCIVCVLCVVVEWCMMIDVVRCSLCVACCA